MPGTIETLMNDHAPPVEDARTPDSPDGGRSVRVVVAEDSATVRYHLVNIIESIPGMRVVGQAADGEAALAMVDDLRPDVVSMDVRMPRMDGLEATRQIMAQCPTPVVIVSGLVETDIDLSFAAVEAGALAVVEKPPDRRNPTFPEKQRHLVKTLAAMAGVSVVRRGIQGGNSRPRVAPPRVQPEVIAIGASAGGPGALNHLLAALPADLPVPVIVVQHIPAEFTSGLVRWLAKSTPLKVDIAGDGQRLKPGTVLLAPGTAHTRVVRQGRELVTRLDAEQGAYRYQPSVDVLFQTVALACGERAVGLVLTGMGDDGATGLLAMREAGAYTLAQDESSSIVYGMPGAAVARGAVGQVLSLAQLPPAILKLVV